MKEKFSFYYDDPDFNILWKKCIFVFDTNVLLNLYSYPKETSEELITLLENLSDRLWIPYQVAVEYQEGRYKSINAQKEFYNKIKNRLRKAKNAFNKELEKEKLKDIDHYYLKPNEILDTLQEENKDLCNKKIKEIEKIEKNHHDFLSDDIIRGRLDNLFSDDKLGDEYTNKKLMDIFEEGSMRYNIKIPPGYGDQNKQLPEKYNDLIIWNQLIDYSKSHKKPIIFVTEDKNKEDWLIKVEDKLLPRYSLLQEFNKETDGQIIYIYDFRQFMDKTNEYLKMEFRRETLEDIEKLKQFRFERSSIFKKPVSSSNIASIDYYKDSQILEIEFNSGGIYQYFNVPESLYNELMLSSSHGHFFYKNIRDYYQWERIE